MNKNKFLVSGAAILGLTLGLQSAVCAAGSFNFETQSRKISVDVDIESPEQPFANLIVLPKDIERSSLSEVNWAEDNTVYKMVYTAGGSVSEEMLLGDSFKPGEYVLYVECGGFDERSAFLVTDKTVADAVSAVNSGKKLSSVSFGADTGFFAANKDIINQLIKNAKPAGGYNDSTFADSYMQISGLIGLMKADIGLDEFVDLYESYFGSDLEFVADMTENEKTTYINAVEQYDIGSCTASEVVSGARFVADCKMAGDKYALADVVEEYIKANKLSSGKYEKLNTYNEPKAMAELKDSVKSLDSAEKIYSAFLEICDKFYKEQSNSSTSGGSGGGGGGGGSTPGRGSGGGVSLPVADTGADATPDSSVSVTFSDIGGHWGESYVRTCVEAGIINGYTDNTFRPDAKITRAETASLISKLFDLGETGADSFSDVGGSDWFKTAVSAAYGAGIVNGYDDGTFRPGSNITRQDMAVMLVRALENEGITIDGSMSFGDDGLIADYAKKSVGALASKGIITGYNNMFRPVDELTRAEAAALICRIMTIRTGGAY